MESAILSIVSLIQVQGFLSSFQLSLINLFNLLLSDNKTDVDQAACGFGLYVSF